MKQKKWWESEELGIAVLLIGMALIFFTVHWWGPWMEKH